MQIEHFFLVVSLLKEFLILIKISQGMTHRTVNNYRGSSSIEDLDLYTRQDIDTTDVSVKE